MTSAPWTRRRLLQTAGIAAAADPLRLLAAAMPAPAAPAALAAGTHCYAAVAASGGAPAGLGVFAWNGSAWQSRQFLPAGAPRLVANDPHGRVLYVAHVSESRRGRPSGSVEAFRIDPHTGLLSPHGRCSLALAARRPAGMALSPDGRLLVVAAHGGVFSLLSLDKDGTPQAVTAVRKELVARQVSSQTMPMRFAGNDLLLVRASHGLKAYRCDADGMHPLPADASAPHTLPDDPAAPLPNVHSFVLRPPTLSKS